MRILLDILHPADLHMLRLYREEMISRGHQVEVAARDKDLTVPLLERYGIPATVISRQRTGRVGLAWEWAVRTNRLRRMARRFRPDVLMGLMGVSIAPVGKLHRTPSVILYDTENATRTNKIFYPMATAVVTPDCYQAPVNGHHITYPGYHETAYLHPDRFTPDPEVVRALGIDPKGWYALVRFVSWEASHDIGEEGLTDERKREIVARLATHGRVLISSEGPLPAELEQYRLAAPVEQIHHIMAFANAVVGESATMASEAAVLGVPAAYIADTGRGYTDDEDRNYGMVRQALPADWEGITAILDELLSLTPAQIRKRHGALLRDKIDTTAWLVDFTERRGWETPASN